MILRPLKSPAALAALAIGLTAAPPAFAQAAPVRDALFEISLPPVLGQASPERDEIFYVCSSVRETYDARLTACNRYIGSGQLTRHALLAALYHRGEAQLRSGTMSAAREDFDAILTIDPEYAWGWVGKGGLLGRDGDTEGALAAFNRGIALEPRASPAHFAIAAIHAASGNLEAAVSAMDRLLAVLPEQTVGLLARGDYLSRLGHFEAALADQNAAVRLQPDYAFARQVRGDTYYKQGDFLRAFSDFDSAVALEPDNAEHLFWRGDVQLQLGRHSDAIADFDAAIRIEPTYADAHRGLCLARAYWGQELDLAVANCTEAIRLKPQDLGYLSYRGMVYLKRGDMSAALSDFDQVLSINPNATIARYGRGVVMIRQGQEAAGRGEIASALAADATLAEGFAGLGIPAP
jgi:tetratricopeptide (TPR) repeat protein